MDGGQQAGGECVALGLELTWPSLRGFLEPAMWGMCTFLEKSHINIPEDSYANRDKSWGLKAREENQAAQKTEATDKSK